MNYYRIIIFALLLISQLLTGQTTQAQQLRFHKQENEKSYQFKYKWLDQKSVEQSLSFAIPKKILFNRFRNFKSYKPAFAQQYVNKHIQQQITKQPIANVQINFNKKNKRFEIKGKNQQAVNTAYQQISNMQQVIRDEYLAKNFYHRFTTYDQVQGIKPNHVKIANSSVEDLKPIKQLILSKVSIKNIRQVTNFSLGFIQSIPYSTLESRISSSGAGFSTPLKLLWENQGDCDSKVTLTVALLRTLMPRIQMVMVFTQQHALMGINIPALANETTIEFEGTTYVLAEPTGPAMFNLGQVAPDSKLAVNNGHYSVEKF